MAKKKQTAHKKKTKRGGPTLTQSARPARSLFRLLPATIFTASLLLTLKMVEIVQTGKQITDSLFIETVMAQQNPPAGVPPVAVATAAPATPPATEAPVEAEGEEKEKKVELPATASTEPPAPTPAGEGLDVPDAQQSFNTRELGILENLSARRERIEQMERDIALREKVLEAAEKRIDEKIAEMKTINEQVKGMLVVQSEEEDTQISSLVKIYEAMKPKDAARIFDEVEMGVLLLVIDRMNERRIAPILAAMSPEKAKDVTQELAAKQKNNREALAETKGKIASPPL